jgi:hypothetical protein
MMQMPVMVAFGVNLGIVPVAVRPDGLWQGILPGDDFDGLAMVGDHFSGHSRLLRRLLLRLCRPRGPELADLAAPWQPVGARPSCSFRLVFCLPMG